MDSVARSASLVAKYPARRLERGSRQGTLGLSLISFLFLVYRAIFSPVLRALGGVAPACKFEPSCSSYAEESFRQLPFTKALLLTFRRVSRCHPWNSSSPFDPVPFCCENHQ